MFSQAAYVAAVKAICTLPPTLLLTKASVLFLALVLVALWAGKLDDKVAVTTEIVRCSPIACLAVCWLLEVVQVVQV